MAERKRDNAIMIRVSAEERAMLDALVQSTGLSQSDLLRQYIRRDYRAEFGREPPRPRARERR
jgi:Mobilization protein NikA